MNRSICFAVLFAIAIGLNGQIPSSHSHCPGFEHRMPVGVPKHRPKVQPRPSAYAQADYVRKVLGLDHKQFKKVHEAYEKYNNEVFGSLASRMDRPHGPGMRGGVPKPVNLKKLEEKKLKQEQKLDKTMRKLFKRNYALYMHWKAIRAEQLRDMFPAHPYH